MATDSQDSKKKIFSRIENLGNVSKAIDSTKMQMDFQSMMGSYDSINKKSNNMLEYFLDLIQLTGGNKAVKRSKKKLINKITTKFKPEIKEILFEEFLRFINCDLGFVIPSADGGGGAGVNDLKIKVKSIDPFGMLKVDPLTKAGKYMYEKEDIGPTVPYPTNKELKQRLNTPNALLISYLGGGGTALFDIEYDDVDSFTVKPIGYNGNYNDNTLTPGNDRKITEFLRDYFDSIEVFDGHNFLAAISNMLSGAVDIQIPKGYKDVEIEGKFLDILKKLLGLCGDEEDGSDGGPISSAPLSHLSDDNADIDSYFDFGPQELRDLEDSTSLKVKGLLRFVTCDSIEGKVNTDLLDDNITNVMNETNQTAQDIMIEQAMNEMVNGLETDDDFSIGLKIPEIGIDFDLQFLKQLPLILISLILSPKILLPLVIVLAALGHQFDADDILDLLRKLWSLIKRILKKIVDFILEVLYEEIKRAILAIIQKIMAEILNEKYLKTFAVIQSLLALLQLAMQLIEDLANCKGILNTLLGLVRLPPIPGGINIPQPLLFATALRPGFSDTRAFQNVLENFQQAGLNTEDHADGSPNQMVMGMYNMIKGIEKERTENSVVKVATYSQTVMTPNGPGTTMPGTGTGVVI